MRSFTRPFLPLAAAAALYAAPAFSAQTPAGPAPVDPAATRPLPGADPSRLPGDGPAASLDRMLQLPRPHPPEPVDTAPGVPSDLALEAAQTALAACSAQGLRVGAAVTDSAGSLRVGLSAQGASPGRIYDAVRKDLAAIAWRRPTSEVQKLLRVDRSSAATLLRPNMVVVPGGVPLFGSGRLLGAVAVSGATGDQDQACADAGAARIRGRLR